MPYHFAHLNISKISVIGAGQIGPDIALHFSKSLIHKDVKVMVVDISQQALDQAKARTYKKIDKDAEKAVITALEAEKIKASLLYSTDYEHVKGSQLVVEAATEDENIKDKIFRQVELLTDDTCIYLSNSSHMQPEVIFRNVKIQSRCLVAHYFFPADRNPVVEIVPSAASDINTTLELVMFYKAMGKMPIIVKSSYGYAIDPIFEGLCQIAVLCLENGMGDEKQIDKVARETLGLGVGPFTALNLTGGNPITAHGLDEMGKKLMPWFKTPKLLHEAVANKTNWNTAARDEQVEVSEDLRTQLHQEFLGGYFALCSFIMDCDISNINDLDTACKVSLVIKAPFTFMNEMGMEKAFEYVKQFCEKHKTFALPKSIALACEAGQWNMGQAEGQNSKT